MTHSLILGIFGFCINSSKLINFCIIIAQHRHRLSDKQLEAMLELLKGNFGDRLKSGAQLPANIRQADSSMREKAGASMFRYDGCISCNQHVWGQPTNQQFVPFAKVVGMMNAGTLGSK